MDQSSALERAGFWRRVFALLIDALIVGAVFQVIAIPAYKLSGGYIQSSGVIRATRCGSLPDVPAGIAVPDGFEPNFAVECTVSFLGFDIGHSVTVGRQTRDGNTTTTLSVGFLLDPAGKPIRGFPLDVLLPPAVLLMRLWLDGGQGSVGRRLLRIRLADARGGESAAPPIGAVAGRYAFFALPFAPGWLLEAYASLFPSFALLGWILPLTVLAGLIALAGAIVATVSVVRRREAFYDRPAGTAVLRLVPAPAEPA